MEFIRFSGFILPTWSNVYLKVMEHYYVLKQKDVNIICGGEKQGLERFMYVLTFFDRSALPSSPYLLKLL